MKLKKYIKHLVFIVLTGVLLFLYEFTSERNLHKKITDIVVEFEAGDNHFLNHQMVQKLLIQNKQTVKNKEKSIVNLYSLENVVLTNPYIEKASVFLTIDGRLKSIIKQREPIVRVFTKSKAYYVDKFGVKIPLSTHFSARVPLVTGVKNKEDVKAVLSLMKYILADSFLQKEIVGIHKYQNEEYQFTVRSGNYRIEFGKLENENIKFKKLKAFYTKTFVDKTIQNYKTITLKYHNQVVCTKINQNGKQ